MAINKVQYGNTTLIDLTDTTAVASDVMQGKYFYGRDGVRVEGTNTGGSGDGYVWQDAQGYVHLSDEEGTLPITDSLTVSHSGTYTAPQGHLYNPVIVPAGTEGTPSATKGAVSNHSVSVTPSVTNTAGYISGGTKTGTAVTVSASELVSGSQTITTNNTYDVTNLASVVVNVSGGTPTLITKSITQNGTYNASADNADGYSSVTVNVSGSSGYTLLGSIEITTSTTSTTAVGLPDTLNLSSSAWTDSKIIYVKVRDKAGRRQGYFYGCDAYLVNNYALDQTFDEVTHSNFAKICLRCDTNGEIQANYATANYGVTVSRLTDDGEMSFTQRYNASNTLTINGTYVVQVYAIDIDPFP